MILNFEFGKFITLMRAISFALLVIGVPAFAQSGPTKLNISGALFTPAGVPVTNSSVNFKLEVMDKNSTCVLYSEEHNGIDLSASKGGFALQIGDGTSAANNIDGTSPAALSAVVFKNSGVIAPFAGCAGGLTLNAGDERVIRVYYDLGGGFVAMNPDVPIASSAYAMVAETLQGKAASDFVQLRDDATYDLNQTNIESIFSAVNFAKLTQILSGNFGGTTVTNVGTPSAGTDATNKNYVDANIGGKIADVTGVGPATGNGATLIWDQALNRWVTGTPSATDNTKLPLAGGTMTGAIAMGGQNITNIGHMTMAAQRTLNLGTYTNAQETTLIAGLGAGDKGKIWFNSDANLFKVWDGSAAVSGFAPTGAAGGDLTGTYPNPTLASGVVATAELANDAVTAAKINNTGIAVNRLLITDATTGANVTYKTCALDESLKWTASGWACTTAAAFIGNTGVTAATYGNATQVSQVAVDAQGRITSASNVNIAFPVVSVAGKTGAVTLNTADISGLGTAAVKDFGTAAGNLVELDAGGKIPASLLPSTSGDIQDVIAGSGLTGGGSSGAVTLNVDTGTTAGKIVQLDASAHLPAVDGRNLSNINAVQLQTRNVAATAPTAAQVLTWNASASAWEPQTLPAGNTGDVTSVSASTGLTGGGASGDLTLSVDVGTTAGKIVQLDASAHLPAVDGRNLSNINAVQLQARNVSSTAPTASQVLAWNASNSSWEPKTESDAFTGTVTSVVSGTGLVAGNITGAGTINIDVGTTAGKIVQLDASAHLPAVDGRNLSNINAVQLQTRNVAATAPTAAQVLTWNASASAWEPQTLPAGNTGDVTSVSAGSGLTGGAASGDATLSVDVGTTANKIVQLDASARLPAVDGSLLTGIAASQVSGAFANGGNSFGAAANLGTDDNFAMNFQANGATAMTILPNGNLGVGATSPQSRMVVNANAAAPNTPTTDTNVHLVGADGSTNRLLIDAHGGPPTLTFRHTNGTAAAPTATVLDDLIGSITYRGYGTSAHGGSHRASIKVNAAENWTNSAQGTYMSFSTAPIGGITNTERVRIDSEGRVGIGTIAPQSPLHVNGIIRATDICDESGANCKDISGGWGGGGDIDGVYTGTGLAGGFASGSGTLSVDVGTTAGKIVQLDASAYLPAVDGRNLSNINAVQLQTRNVAATAPTAAQVLTWNASASAWEPQTLPAGNVGDVTSVSAGLGLTGGAASGDATLSVDVGTTANKIVQLDSSARIPAVDGSQLTGLTASQVAGAFANGGNNFTATATLGTNTNHALELKTNGASVMSLLANGNIGIATTAPADMLTVSKPAAVNDSTRIAITTSGTLGNQQAVVNLVTQDNGAIMGTSAANKGWQLFGRGNAFSTGSQQNDFGIAYWSGGGWSTPLQIDSATGYTSLGTGNAPSRLTVEGSMALDQLGADPAGAAGYGTLFVRDDGKLYYRDGTGSIKDLSATGNGSVTSVVAGGGLTGGNISVTGTLAVDTGTTAGKIVQLDVSARLPAVNGSQLTDITASQISGVFADGGNTFTADATLGTNSNHALNIEANGATAMTVLPGGNVGIGTTSPSTRFYVTESYSGAATTKQVAQTRLNYTPSAAPGVGTVVQALRTKITTGGTSDLSNVDAEATQSTVEHNQSTTLAGAISLIGDVENSSTGSIADARGTYSEVENLSSGSITNGYGVWARVQNESTGSITNAYAGNFEVLNSTGTVTNGYGVYIANIQATNKFGLYQADATASNYFAGSLGVGTSTVRSSVSIAGSGSLGLEASDTDLQAGDTVGAIQFRSNESSTTSPPADDIVAQISAVANAQHTAGYWPTDLIFSTVNGSNVLSESMRIKPGGNVGIGTANPQAPLHVNGVVRATDICDENGANCKDISGGWGGGGDIDGVYTGTGLTGGFASGSGTLSVDVGTTANKIVQLDASARLPAVNGSQLTNVNAAQLQTREVASTAPTAAQVLGWNAGSSQWEPQTVSVAGGGGFVNGGNSFGVGAVLGTNDNNTLTLETNNSAAVTILANGNVGIGLTNPAEKLHVNGNIGANTIAGSITQTIRGVVNPYADTSAALNVPDGATNFVWNTSNTDGVGAFTVFTANNTSAVDQSVYIGAISTTGAATHTPEFIIGQQTGDTAYAERLRIAQNGNVGIGTTAPASKLHVNGTLRVGGATAPFAYFGQDGIGSWHEQRGSNAATAPLRLQSSVAGDATNYSTFKVDPANGFSFIGGGTANGNVGIGTVSPQAPLHVNGIVRATDICDENGANCKDISSGWGVGGDIDGVYSGTGLTGGFASGSGTLSVDVGTTANKIVQLDSSARLPAVNGSQLTNVNAAQLQTRNVASTAPTASQVLAWNAGNSTWEPKTETDAFTGTVTSVVAGSGLTGGNITSTGTLTVDSGTTANKIVQLDSSARLPAVNGSQLTNINAVQLQARNVASTAPTASQVLAWNAGNSTWEPQTVSASSSGGFVNNGNSFAGTATLGTNDANNLVIETSGNPQTTFFADGDITFGNGSSLYGGQKKFVFFSNPYNETNDFIHINNDAYFNQDGNTGTVEGMRNWIRSNAPNSHNNMYAARNRIDHWGAGSLANGVGSYNEVVNNGAPLTNATGSLSRIEAGANTTTNAYGFRAQIAGAGTVTNSHGLYIDSLIGTNRWGVYQAGSADNNYFAGKVGIGTTAPSYKLEVSETVTNTGNWWVTSAVDQTYNPSSAPGAASYIDGHLTRITTAGTSNLSNVNLEVANTQARHNVATTLGYAAATNGVVYNLAGGTITSSRGVLASSINSSTGTITGATGLVAEVKNENAGGTIGTAYGLYASIMNSGTINTGYGLYLGNIQATAKWGVYQTDSTSPNYFNGVTTVGTTTAGTGNKFTVEGGAIKARTGSGAGQGGEVRFEESSGAGNNYIALRAPDSIGATETWILPSTAPTNGQVLSWTTGGQLSWATVPASGGTIAAGTGSAAAPSLSFSADPDTGFYNASSNNTISVTTGNSNIFNFSSAGLVSPTTGGALVTSAAGTVGAPTYAFAGDPNTGWWSPAADTMAASTNGAERMRIDSNGNIGIGTNNPTHWLMLQRTDTTTATGTLRGSYSEMRIQPSTAHAAGASRVADAGYAYVPAATTVNLESVKGNYGMVENYANGNTINSMIGSQGWAYSNGTASINYLSGAWFGSQAGAGTVTGLDGLAVSSTVSGATVTAQTGLNVSLANSSGTLGYRYGIFLNTPTGAAPTSGDFGIYQQSTSGKNYFGAQTGIGTVGPQGKLEVRSGSDFNAITLSTNVADGNDTGGVITGKRKTNSNSPFGALATWDWGTERKVYIGGGNWNMPSATQVSIYAQPSYDETTNTYEELFQVDGSGYTNIYGPWTSFNRWGDNTYGHWQEFYKARGTRSAPTAVLSGDDLGNIWAGAYNGTNWSSNGGARISFSASENQTATNGGTRISFHTTPNGSQTISTAMTISDQGYVGIGTTSPGTGLHVVGTGMRMQRNNDTAGNGAAISLYRSRGTSSSPAAVQTGDSLGEVWGYGHDGSAYGSGGGMQIEADGNWTGTSRPNRLKLFTTPTGATANSTRMTILENGNVGINTTAPTHRLHVIGTAGLSTGTAWTNTSDLRLKDVHGEYKIGLQEILKLKTVRFSYKKNNPLGLESDRVITGFVAQEVQQVIPEAVNIREDGYLELNVDPIHWATVNAVQELHGLCQMSGEQSQELSNRVAQHDREITTLKRQVQSLKEENAALKEAVCEINPNANICK